MIRFALGIVFGFLLLVKAPAFAGTFSIEEALADKVMGSKDAPVTMIEYSSLGCGHCATFHEETLPKIKETYIDTGKVKLVFSDFPLGTVALAASMLARCAAPERFFGFIKVIFRSQETWATSQKPVDELRRLSRFAGINDEAFQACLQNEPLMNGIRAQADAAKKKHGINATPIFIINGTKVEGAQPLENFKKVIDEALEK